MKVRGRKGTDEGGKERVQILRPHMKTHDKTIQPVPGDGPNIQAQVGTRQPVRQLE